MKVRSKLYWSYKVGGVGYAFSLLPTVEVRAVNHGDGDWVFDVLFRFLFLDHCVTVRSKKYDEIEKRIVM